MSNSYNPHKVSTQIGVPIAEWGGNCHGISTKMVAKNLVPGGKVVRGLWIGEIAIGNMFSGRPFTGHSWIETPDGTIVDPTRWVFTNDQPKIYVGPNDGNYDKGGNLIRQIMERPYPIWNPSEKSEELAIGAEALTRIGELVNDWPEFSTSPNNDGVFCKGQLFWIANLSPDALDEYAWEIYTALEEIGWEPAIPFDNWNVVMG